jgi:hypothetical protein
MDKYIAPVKYGNCIYYLDVESNKVIKICDVTGNEDLPQEVREVYANLGNVFKDVVSK